MSLYNMLFGQNPAAGILTAALQLDGPAPDGFHDKLQAFDDGWGEYDLSSAEARTLLQEAKDAKYFPTGRFRDIFFERDESGKGNIILYTRNGGGNRDAYEWVFTLLEEHPLYLSDWDDDFDSTYAYIKFSAPKEIEEFFEGVEAGKFERVSERFQREIQEMEEGKEPTAQLMQVIGRIAEAMKD